MNLARQARCLLRARRHAVLSTISQAVAGYPFGSVVPYVLDAEACPIVLVSRLAEHARNIGVDPRVSLTIIADGADVQQSGRVTYVGRALRLDPPGSAGERYLRFFPAAREYRNLDFDFFRIEPVTLRVIAGFAQAHWLSREAYTPAASDLAGREETIAAELNTEHAATLCALAVSRNSSAPESAIVGIDCDGFDVRAGGDTLRFDFDDCVADADAARARIAALLQQARPH
jgi:heme oxygenase (biliverdin-IX-beta and delta-forming)